MTVFVLDNSVTMRWCFDAGTHAYADGVQLQLEAIDGLAFVPVLWRYEVSNVLAGAVRTGKLSAQESLEFITDLGTFDIIVDTRSVDHILSDVHQLAMTYQLTSYDAAYLELALRRNLPLATLDKELIQACQAAGVAIL